MSDINNRESLLNCTDEVSTYLKTNPKDDVKFVSLVQKYSLKNVMGAILVYLKLEEIQNNEEKTAELINGILSSLNKSTSVVLDKALNTDLALVDNFLSYINYLEHIFKIVPDDKILLSFKMQFNNYIRNVKSDTTLTVKGVGNANANFDTIDLSMIKEGTLFGMRAVDLLTVDFNETTKENDEKLYCFTVPSLINSIKDFENTLLIFMYLGNGECMEYYTGNIVNIENPRFHILKNIYYGDIPSMLEPLAHIRKTPLLISQDRDDKFFAVNQNFKLAFAEQTEQEQKVIKYAINTIYESSKGKIERKIKDMVNRDYDEAMKLHSLESGLIDFRKMLKK